MGKDRDLQKLLEFGQMNLTNKEAKALEKIKGDLVVRFFKDIPYTQTGFTTLAYAQDRLSDIGKALVAWKKDGVEMSIMYDTSDTKLTSKGNTISTIIEWEEHLRIQFLYLLNGVTKDDLIVCKQCGRIFTRVGKKKKDFCSPRCGVDYHRSK